MKQKKYRFKLDETEEDVINIIVLDNNIKIGSLTIILLHDDYSDFSDILEEEEFDDLFPLISIIEINNLYINDDYRFSGIGTKLMKYGIKLMQDKGYSQFYLNACARNCDGIIKNKLVKFYNKFKFKILLDQGNNVLMYLNN